MEVKDSNGTLLNEGRFSNINQRLESERLFNEFKRGTLVKNIKLTDDDEEIEGRVEKQMMVLKTCFLKKV